MKDKFLWNRFFGFIACVTFSSLFGCATSDGGKLSSVDRVIRFPQPNNATIWIGRAVGPTIGDITNRHVWMPLKRTADSKWEAPRPRIFTYVLAGNSGGEKYRGSNELILQARRILESLVNEVRGEDEYSKNNIYRAVGDLRKVNIFLIPESVSPLSSGEFGYEISNTYRDKIDFHISKDHPLKNVLRKRGPFIISTTIPINDLPDTQDDSRVSIDFLIMDLTGISEKSVPVYVAVFKRALEDRGVVGGSDVKSMRAVIVSNLLKLNQSLPLIATATVGISSATGIGPKSK